MNNMKSQSVKVTPHKVITPNIITPKTTTPKTTTLPKAKPATREDYRQVLELARSIAGQKITLDDLLELLNCALRANGYTEQDERTLFGSDRKATEIRDVITYLKGYEAGQAKFKKPVEHQGTEGVITEGAITND